MNRSIVILCVTLFAAVAGTSGYFLAQPNALTPRVKQLELDLTKAREEISHLQSERDQLIAAAKKVEAPPPSALAAVGSSKPATQPMRPESAGPGKGGADFGSAMRKMMEAPGMKDMMRKQQEVQIDMAYGKLFQKLGLDDKELENFKQLLSDRVAAQMENGMKLADGSLTDDQRKAIANQLNEQKSQSDGAIRKFLNNQEDFKIFQNWEDTQGERMQLQVAGSAFETAGAPLSDDQRERLVQLMADARKGGNQAAGLSDRSQKMLPENLSDDGIAKQLKVQDGINAQVVRDAASFLSPPQIEALKKMQEQMRSMSEASLHMASQMFGGKK